VGTSSLHFLFISSPDYGIEFSAVSFIQSPDYKYEFSEVPANLIPKLRGRVLRSLATLGLILQHMEP